MKKQSTYIEKLLSKNISFYHKLNADEKEELWGVLSEYERYRVQRKNQKRVGFGKDKFTLNEYGSMDRDLAKYRNLKQWDKEQYKYQKAHGQSHLDKSYKLYLFGDWCRLIENNKLIYGEIFSLHGYIFDRVAERLNRFEDGLYPHSTKLQFIKNKKKRKNAVTGKKEHFYRMETTTKAYGKEEELEAFQKFMSAFEHGILYPKIKKYVLKHLTNRTYRIVQKKATFDNYHQFLFSDKKVLKECHFESFLDDFNRFRRDERELKAIEKQFYRYAKHYVMKSFRAALE
ncbi:MAG: hypothetical protein JXQ76_05030 [Campylobacterales bacterium]|nr:hypothetical protein [Campylobacterales bacterium]